MRGAEQAVAFLLLAVAYLNVGLFAVVVRRYRRKPTSLAFVPGQELDRDQSRMLRLVACIWLTDALVLVLATALLVMALLVRDWPGVAFAVFMIICSFMEWWLPKGRRVLKLIGEKSRARIRAMTEKMPRGSVPQGA